MQGDLKGIVSRRVGWERVSKIDQPMSVVYKQTSGIRAFTLYLFGKVTPCVGISESCKSLPCLDMKPNSVVSAH